MGSESPSGDMLTAVRKPQWNMSPNTFPPYLVQLRRWLPSVDARYSDLVERRVVVDRGKVCCHDATHLQFIRNGTVTKGTFANPYLVTTYAPAPNRGPISPATSASTAPATAPATTPSSAPAPSAAATAPSATTSSSSATSSSDRHVENPDSINVLDSRMYDHICSTFDDEDYKLNLEKNHGRSGVMVLVEFTFAYVKMQSDTTSLTYGSSLLTDFEEKYKEGIPSVRVEDFTTFQNSLSAIRRVLPDDCPMPDPLFAQRLVTAARELGTDVATRLDNLLDNRRARGDLQKSKSCIIEVLSILEADERKNGRGLAARQQPPARKAATDPKDDGKGLATKPDPRRTEKKGHPDRPFDKERDQPCKWHKLLGLGCGYHWNNDCPKKAEGIALVKSKAEEKPGSESGKGLLLTGQASDDEDDSIEAAASKALFASSNLTDLESIDDAASLLSALTSGNAASSANSVSKAGTEGRGLMLRGEGDEHSDSSSSTPDLLANSGSNSDDSEAQADSLPSFPTASQAPAPAPAPAPIDDTPGDPRPRARVGGTARLYVIPTGGADHAGIFFGTWDAPDHVRRLAEAHPAHGCPTSLRVPGADLDAAVRICEEASPRYSSIFRGPQLLADHPDLAIGRDTRVYLDRPGSTPLTSAPASGQHTADDTVQHAAASVARPPEAASRAFVPLGFQSASHPSRVRLRQSLVRIYQHAPNSHREHGGLLPGHQLPAPGDEYRTIKASSVAKLILTQACSDPKQTANRLAHPPNGDRIYRAAVADMRSSFSDMLEVIAGGDPLVEHTAAHELGPVLLPDFEEARAVGLPDQRSSLFGFSVPSSVGTTLGSIGSAFCTLFACAVAGAVGAFAMQRLHDPGMAYYSSLWLLLALSPVLLTSIMLTLLSAVAYVLQAKRLGAGPPPGPRSPSLSPLQRRRRLSVSNRADHLRRASAVLLINEISPSRLLSWPAHVLVVVIAFYFLLGTYLLQCEDAPAVPLQLRLSPSFAAARTKQFLLGAGGVARFIRRSPIRIIRLIVLVTTIGCLGRLQTTADPPSLPFGYRATCEFDKLDVIWKTKRKRQPEAKHTNPAEHGFAFNARPLNLTESTYRALLNRPAKSSHDALYIDLVLDSGCTMHCHPHESDLINRRPSRDTMSGIEGKKRKVTCIGDLPIVAKDKHGKLIKLIIRGVRCVPGFTETLISVDRLFEECKAEVRFGDHRKVYAQDTKGRRVSFPFTRAPDRLYTWSVKLDRRSSPFTGSRTQSISHGVDGLALLADELPFDVARYHRPKSTSYMHVMDSDTLAAALHHRLHLSPSIIARLPSLASDMPAKLSRLAGAPCPHCMEANATRHPHAASDVYKPSYVGRLTHADIVGPFKRSVGGHFRYALVLVDDHSRYKAVHFLQKKSDALKEVRKYVASLNAHLNRGRAHPTKIVGSLHTDNAGEFLSHEFTEFIDSESIKQTTCPPHVHSLNGVAERAIRSIIENARSHIVASGCPIGFWPYAVEHAVEVLNRCTGPTESNVSSFEMMQGVKPKVLSLQPFGCRVVAVKPRHTYSKTELDPHGVAGINLGMSSSITSGYRAWIPTRSSIMSTSDMYFDATFMPWRARGDQRIGPVPLVSSPAAESLPPPLAASDTLVDPPAPVQPESIAEAFDSATRGRPSAARRSNRVLVLFSGSYSRPDGLGAFLHKLGYEVEMVDNHHLTGNPAHDVADDEFFTRLLQRVQLGEFFCVFAAPPCSTFSVSRLAPDSDGPPPVRSRDHPSGLPDVDPRYAKELRIANLLIARTVAILAAGWQSGSEFVIENPVDRGDRDYPLHFIDGRHAPLWLVPEIKALLRVTGASQVHFPQCMFGSDWQKRTTLAYTAGLDSWLSPLRTLACTHVTHDKRAGGARDDQGNWLSAESAAYPPELNLYLAKAIGSIKSGPIKSAVHVEKPAPNSAPIDTTEPEENEPSDPVTVEANRRPPNTVAPPSPIRGLDFSGGLGPISETEETVSPLPVPIDPSTRDFNVWGFRKYAGSPIRASLRPRPGRALFMLAGALLSLAPPINGCGGATNGRALTARDSPDPQSRSAALALDHDGWTRSMDDEMENHKTNGSFEWVSRDKVPKNRRLIKLIWVYKIKRNGKLKSRLCVQGCNQVKGIDYDQTFSAALRSPSLRVLSSFAARHDLRLHRWDFVSAYLQGELEEGEDVFCLPPPGYERKDEATGQQLVCRVIKPIYGMAQAGRRWQRSLFPWLKDFGLSQSEHDPCIFHMTQEVDTPKGKRTERLAIGCYVDDLCCAYSHADKYSIYHKFTTALKEWNVEDEGPLNDLLGVEFDFSDGHVHLRQTAYIEKLVARYLSAPPIKTKHNKVPCYDELVQHVADALVSQDPPEAQLLRDYQSLVGALLYCATNSRPDIAYSVGMLCRAMAKPTIELLSDARLVLEYLYRTRMLGLRYASSQRPLYGMSDSDWAVKHSTSGHVFMLNEAAISWGSKKQVSVALSSCEAEIVAASEACKEAVHLSGLTTELGLHDGSPVDLHMDNQSGIAVAYNPEKHNQMKHVARRHFYVRECIEDFRIRAPFVQSHDNLADFFTKCQPPKLFRRMRDIIMNVPQCTGGRCDQDTGAPEPLAPNAAAGRSGG